MTPTLPSAVCDQLGMSSIEETPSPGAIKRIDAAHAELRAAIASLKRGQGILLTPDSLTSTILSEAPTRFEEMRELLEVEWLTTITLTRLPHLVGLGDDEGLLKSDAELNLLRDRVVWDRTPHRGACVGGSLPTMFAQRAAK